MFAALHLRGGWHCTSQPAAALAFRHLLDAPRPPPAQAAGKHLDVVVVVVQNLHGNKIKGLVHAGIAQQNAGAPPLAA